MSTDSVITQQQLSFDILESPIFQDWVVCLQRYLTWLSSHDIGLALTVETALLNAAFNTHRRLDQQVNHSSYDLPLEQHSQLQQQLVELTVFCRRLAPYVDYRRSSTFLEFAAETEYPVWFIEEAWDVRCSTAEDITYAITKMGWDSIEEARYYAEMEWRLGRTNNRPQLLNMMPVRQVVLDETLRELIVATPPNTSSSSTPSSSSASPPSSSSTTSSPSSSSSSSTSETETTPSGDLAALPDRTRKDSTS